MSAKKIFYNTLLQSLGKIVSVGLGLITIAYLVPYLGQSGFGEYTTIISFMGFAGVLADLGLYLVATKEISVAGADEKYILGNIFSLRFVSVILMLVLGAVIALFFPYSAAVKTGMFAAILAFTFVSGTQVLVGVFQKYLVYYELIASEILQRLIALLGTLTLIFFKLPLLYFIGVLAAANAVHFFLSLYLARRYVAFKLRWDFSFWKIILSQSWPLAFSVVLNLIYFKADTIMLSILKPAKDVGLYGLAYKFLEVLLAFPAMFAGLIMPFLAKSAFIAWPKYRVYLQKSFDAVLLTIVPIVTVVLFSARPIINLVGGQIYPDADKVLQILVVAAAVSYPGNLLGYAVVALNKQKQMVWGYLLGTVIGLLSYLLLIPKLSYFGAAIGTVIVEVCVAGFAYVLTSKSTRFYPSFSILIRSLVAALPMIAIFSFLPVNWMTQTLLGLICYGAGLLMLRAVPLDFVKEIILNRNREPKSASETVA